MANPFEYHEEHLQLVHPPRLSRLLTISIPSHGQYYHSLVGDDAHQLTAHMQQMREEHGSRFGLENMLAVLVKLEGLRNENWPAHIWYIVNSFVQPEPPIASYLPPNVFDLYETPEPPRLGMMTFSDRTRTLQQMSQVIMRGYQKQYNSQERLPG